MTTKATTRSLVQLACAVSLAGGLYGCGGGGGGGGNATGDVVSSSPTLAITSQNSDAVGHFAAVAALGLQMSWGSSNSVSLTGGLARSAAPGSRFALLQALHARFSNADGSRSQSLQVLESGEVPCSNAGGTMSITIDDADNNGAETPGDVETAVFKNCMLAPNETYDGTMRLDVADVTDASITYNVTLTQFSYGTPNHSLTFNGSYVAQESLADPVLTTTLTANGAVTIAVATHAPYSDTLTLANGFVVREQMDYGARRAALSVAGRVESASVGGSVDISAANLTTSTAAIGMYPDNGVLHVKGKVGALSITALSSASVCLDTDSNDDGLIESSKTQSWDWLL